MSEEPDFSTLPVEQRLAHKVWKARLQAYEEVAKKYESSRNEKDECFYIVLDFKGVVTDSNVVAQEAGINLLLNYLKFGATPAIVKSLRNSNVVTSLCEKGLLSSRAGTKDKSTQCLLLFVEIAAASDLEGIIEDILLLLGNRLPKLVAGCVSALATIVANFGCQIVPAKLIIPYLPKLFAHADRNVRAETQKLTIEIYKWMRDALVNVLFQDLKPIQQKELIKAFEAVTEPPSQLRYTRRQQAEIERKQRESEERAAAAAASSGNDAHQTEDVVMEDADADGEFNPLDLIDPVEVLSKLPSDFGTRIGSSNWKERKEVLDEVHAILEKTVKLQSGDDYTEIMRYFTKCMKDANVQVVQLAADCVQFLANGLQTNFHRYQNMILSTMLERTKEKKASVADALNKALDSIFKSSSLSDVLEDTINTGMKHKTPQVKIATTNYLQRCLAETKNPPKLAEIDLIMEIGVRLLSDSQEPVRRASIEMIGTLMKITGPRELTQFLEKVDDNRKGKITEFCDKVTVKAKMGRSVLAPAAPPSKRSSAAPLAKQAPPRVAVASGLGAGSHSGPSSNTIGGSKLSLPAAPSGLKKPRSTNLIPTKRTATSPVKRADAEMPRNSLRSGFGMNSDISTRINDSMTSEEREELVNLRQQAAQWKQKEQQYQQQLQQRADEDRRQFEQELSTLQRRNESLMKDYNSSHITIKQKETQILRLTSDLESCKLKIRDLEQSVELKKLQDNVHMPPPESNSTSLLFQNPLPMRNRYSTLYLNEYPPSRVTSGELSSRVKRLSIDPDQPKKEDVYENRYSQMNKYSPAKKMVETTNITNHGSSAANKEKEFDISNSNDDTWRRAAEVTLQLKARIEAMKERSRVNFQKD